MGTMDLRLIKASAAVVFSRHAFRDSAENFVRERIREAGLLPGVDGTRFAFAEQDDFIPQGHVGNAGHIYQGEVHGNTADDGSVVVTDYDATAIRKLAHQAISVAEWQHRDSRVRLRHKRPAIAQRLPGRSVVNGKHKGLPGKHGPQGESGRSFGFEITATLQWQAVSIEGEARTDHAAP